jgi:hypothetical protein
MQHKILKIGGAVFGVILILVASGIGKLAGRSAVQKISDDVNQGALEKAQEIAAADLRKQLPIELDEMTTLQTALSAGSSLIYIYRIHQDIGEIDVRSVSSEMQQKLFKNVCGEKILRKNMSIGAKYIYRYFSRDGIQFAIFDFDKNICGIQ